MASELDLQAIRERRGELGGMAERPARHRGRFPMAVRAPEMTDEQFAAYLADSIVRIEANYCREGSGPGSRFAGQRLEDVQVRFMLREVAHRAGKGR